ncbi:prolyl oligopeptidase family protein [soil metagenome]
MLDWKAIMVPLLSAILPCVLASGMAGTQMQTPLTAEQTDPYIWLEDVWGKRSMDWVNAENARTIKELQGDPRFTELSAEALKIAESPDRLPSPDFRNGMVYNTWQDAEHPQGILRRTTLADYKNAHPDWKTVLDYDALGKKDGEKWVHSGVIGLYPGDGRALVGLSAGGEDAVTLREFDLKAGEFVKDGFVLPKSKQTADWTEKDTLLVSRDWGEGTMTASGYPYVVKTWKRGTPLGEAKEVYRGTPTDVSVDPFVLHDSQGHQLALINRGVNFFESEVFVWSSKGVRQLGLPKKIQINGLLDGHMIVMLNEDWGAFKQGSVVSVPLDGIEKDPLHLTPTVVFAPTAKEFAQSVGLTRHKMILTTLENVQGRAYVVSPGPKGTWNRKKLDVPDNEAVSIETTDDSSEEFFLSLSGFLTPSTLLLGDATKGSLVATKTRQPQFDASNMTVEQLEATSSDGTKVPYFLVHKKDIPYDGSTPTLLNAYGGFLSSSTPFYSGNVGKLWLERGGAFVLANIRGGAEFGPAWHDAGLKTHRQRIYDDFSAVGKDLFDRKITSPRRLGIMGGSNGGLLVGVEMTQRPDMWNAVVIQVPLLDMLRFEQIAAGASWVGEYGSVSIPEERKFLASISPYNQLRKDANYPEPLIFTTTKDDRVGPVHARKFAARMEEFGKPFYYYEIVEGGHGSGADLKEQAKTNATTYIYLIRKLID